MRKLISLLVISALMLCGCAAAESASEPLFSMPERGILLPLTQEDTNNGLTITAAKKATDEIAEVPVFDITFNDYEGMQAVLSTYSDEQLSSEEYFYEIMYSLYAHIYPLSTTVLFEKEYYDAKMAEGKTAADLIGGEPRVIGENDGYVYVSVGYGLASDDAAVQEKIDWATARIDELLSSISFQPVEFAPGEFTQVPGAFPAFTTVDLNGNTVTNDIFSGKKLTVVNIWGTFCGPCINEMPELAAWDAEMPEDVQIIGLVSDLPSADDAETLELAKAICEKTGVVFPSLVANEDFMPLLSGVIGVPTTVFVDGNGVLVGDPIVGANVPAYKQFVEGYLNAQ